MTTMTTNKGGSIFNRTQQAVGSSDNFQTPIYPLAILEKCLGNRLKNKVVVDPACGEGRILEYYGKNNLVSGNDINDLYTEFPRDFLKVEDQKDFTATYLSPDCKFEDAIIITNPPYSLKNEFIEQCLSLRIPFAMLMPLTALGTKHRWDIFKEHGIELIIPRNRVNYKTPSGRGSGAWFDSAWFCHGLNLPQQIVFEDVEDEEV